MTATEKLRDMLDERGLEWTHGGMFHRTHWVIDGIHYVAFEQGGKLYLQSSMGPLTVEQAIAATLGAGTCHIAERNGDWYCDACGEMVGTCDPTSELLIDGNAVKLWEYCPRCGRRIEEVTE